jgi:hypothetical protein
MTNPRKQSLPAEEPDWSTLHSQPQEDIAAELRDAGGQVLSTGIAHYFADEKGAFLYPRDGATLDSVQGRGEILFLIPSKQSLQVVGISDCPNGNQPELHFHIKLR